MAEKLYYDTSGTSFKEAFADARGEGKKSFEWNGKKYTTDLASSKSKAKAEEPKSEAKEESSESSEPEEKEEAVGRTRAGTKVPKADVSAGPKNSFITKERSDAASESMRNARKGNQIFNFSTDKKSVGDTRIRSAGMSAKANSNVHGMKKGGAVKSSASSRGDGIAQRGKTRGRMV